MKNLIHLTKIILLGLILTGAWDISFAFGIGEQKDTSLNLHIEAPVWSKDTANAASETISLKNKRNSISLDKARFSNPFPNPASSFVKINYQFPSVSDKGKVMIIDLTGRIIMTRPIGGDNRTLKINVNSLYRGLYFYTIYYKGRLIKSSKLIVSNQKL